MKRTAIICIASAIVLILVGKAVLTHRSYEHALVAFRASRDPSNLNSEYDVVARGVTAGMSHAAVNQKMGQPRNSRTLMTNTDNGPEPYAAAFYFRHEGDKLGMMYITEYYTVFFNDMKRATRIEYDVFDKGGETQRIDVDLHEGTLSEPLQVPWSK